jgi:TIR domain/AAA ATPase domain
VATIFISHSSRDHEAAQRFMTWLQSQGFDTPFLDFDKHAGIAPGSNWEKTLYREVERSEAIIIVQTPNWLDSKWCFAEFTQARALGKPIFPVIEAPTGDTLIAPDIQSLNLLKDREGGLEQLARELTRIVLDAQGGFPWDANRPPYPGLLAFQEQDAAIYFGRDDDIRRLIERLNARHTQGGTKLIVLLGASGSGKSSLLRAGVIPRIKRDARNWMVLPPMRPQAHPVDELARTIAIALDKGTEWRAWRDRLREGDLAAMLSDLANDLRARAGTNEAQILISIDQAEELFSIDQAKKLFGASMPEEADRSEETDRFFEILSVAMSEELPYLVLLTMRSDYLERLQSATKLKAPFEEFSLGPLPLSRYAQIIEGPARVAGIGIEDEFVQQASRDAETEDALPLLAFALRELYDRNVKHDNLTLAEYRGLGDPKEGLTPLENAVRKAADAVLDEFRPTDDQLTALRDAFVPAMVQVNDKGEFARQPARWDDLPANAYPILERLAKARLLILRQDGDARMVEVAHEALLRKWPRLRAWLEDAREFLIGKQQLKRDLSDWEHATEADKSGALLSRLKLHRAREWLVARPHQLSAKERAFIQASIQSAEAEERRKVRLRRYITIGLNRSGRSGPNAASGGLLAMVVSRSKNHICP